MPFKRTIRVILSFAFALFVVSSRPAIAGQIVGITLNSGILRRQPITGSTTSLRPRVPFSGLISGASGSPDAGTIFYSSVNLRGSNVTTFQDTSIGGILHAFDLAFDRGKNTLYETSGSALFSVQCPSPPNQCRETPVGPAFPTSHMQALGFIAR